MYTIIGRIRRNLPNSIKTVSLTARLQERQSTEEDRIMTANFLHLSANTAVQDGRKKEAEAGVTETHQKQKRNSLKDIKALRKLFCSTKILWASAIPSFMMWSRSKMVYKHIKVNPNSVKLTSKKYIIH